MRYQHTQIGRLHWVMLIIAGPLLLTAWVLRGDLFFCYVFLGLSLIFLVLAMCFRQLTVRDEGKRLLVRFGPLPLFHTEIPYTSITSVEAGHSSVLDGWGIHYLPGRGWTWNLHGFECVVVHRGRKILRIGTDDAAGLLRFLERTI